MNEAQRAYARKKAYGAAGIAPADFAATEAAYQTAYDEAKAVGLADHTEALRSALQARGVDAAHTDQAIKRYQALEASAEGRRGTGRHRLRRAIIAVVAMVAIVVALVVVASLASPGGSGTASTRTPAPTYHAVVDRPLDGQGTPPAP